MLVKISIKVVTGDSKAGCFAMQNTEVTIDGNKHLIKAILDKIKEIPNVEIK